MNNESAKKRHRPHKFASNTTENTIPLFRQQMPPSLLAAIMKRPLNVVEALASEDCPIEIAAYYFCCSAVEAELELRENPLFIKHVDSNKTQTFADRRLLLGCEKMIADRCAQIIEKMRTLQDEENRYGSLDEKQQKTMDMLQKTAAKLAQLNNFAYLHTEGQLFSVVCEQSMLLTVQTLFFLLLTHSVKVREIVCQKTNALRMSNHECFGTQLFANTLFFDNLITLTTSYVSFEIDEAEYVSKVRYLARTGTTLQIN